MRCGASYGPGGGRRRQQERAGLDCRWGGRAARRHAVRGEVYTGRQAREAADDRDARSVQDRARPQIGGRARGGAHPEHEEHGCDAGGVEAQWLVERRRFLPRFERRACGRGEVYRRAQAGGGRAIAVQAAFRAGLDCRFGAGRREERTLNMEPMATTLEVSKLSGWSNADAPCRGSKGGHAVCMGRGMRVGRREAAAHAACRREGSTADWGQGTGRSARRRCSTWL